MCFEQIMNTAMANVKGKKHWIKLFIYIGIVNVLIVENV